MKKAKWAAGIGCGALALLLVLTWPGFLLAALLIAGSKTTVFEQANSPDGWHVARVEFTDYGAVSSYSRTVLIENRWLQFLRCSPFSAKGKQAVHLRWIDNRTLAIEHAFSAQDVEYQESECAGVKIIVSSL